MRQVSLDDADDDQEDEGVVQDDQEWDQDMAGPAGDGGEDESDSDDVLEDPEAAPLLTHQEPTTKRRRVSGKKRIEREWTEEDLPPQQLPASNIQPRELDDCHKDVHFFLKMFGANNIQLLTEQTNLLRQKQSIQKNRNIPAISVKEMRQTLGIIMYMSIVHLPNMRSYWRKSLRNEMVANVMARDRFELIVSLLHLSDNDLQPRKNSPDYDRLYKVRIFLKIK